VGILLAVLFFGGFLVKSYWEEHVFARDTKRLLRYYKHVVPGSIHDGDVDSARYIVWKYRHEKDKLWKVLEKKYGEPVLQLHEYPDDDTTGTASPEKEETVDLDDDDAAKTNTGTEGNDDEPDL
jgi:hypothetical protein